MSTLEIISTARVPPRKKIQFWNAAISAAVASADADPLDQNSFQGQLKLLDLGDIRMAEIHGGASYVRRHAIRTLETNFVVQLLLAGEVVCYSQGIRTRLGPGDFWLFGPNSSAELTLPEPVSMLAICVKREFLAHYLAYPDAATGKVISGKSGPGTLIGRYIRDFWRTAQIDFAPHLLPRFAEFGLQMLAGAYAGIPEGGPHPLTIQTDRLTRIRSYIEENLSNPDLTPQSIADAVNITPGYLHRLFSRGTESIARYILRRRLEECHRDLTDCGQLTASITTIAFRHGFNSLQHFSRVFRGHFHATPTQVREQAFRGKPSTPMLHS